MRIEEFDYSLPDDFIAQQPLEDRDKSRLLVVKRKDGSVEHRIFNEIPQYMQNGDVLVINNTRVIPARLFGTKETGGKCEVLTLRQLSRSYIEDNIELSEWECLIKASKHPKEGQKIFFNECCQGKVINKRPNGKSVIRFQTNENFEDTLNRIGKVPLPPYIKRNEKLRDFKGDLQRYQTVYAKKKGAIAAHTAGLHFTEGLISEIQKKGVKIVRITVHIGLGTFMPIRVKDIENHVLEAEYFEINREAAFLINEAVVGKRKIISVGTSTTRALESATYQDKSVKPMSGFTSLFIYNGYQFKIVDALVTNFHQPKSTPLLLVSAFGGKEIIKDTYKRAIKEKYRFLSYGDGMLIL
ncbi:MAG: tRNA preQ1(34) S-adenosylmethionine ribosyltransferase-isomerase QueA [Thermodesulfobacteriota bacterium]|nr:tRNA preQ1(34) S-adenosylmethionine ribosyltransferase-isomerase QueA [Thermodesulfobacteriota bacterium]